MQTQKDEIRRQILRVARDEFLKHGVKHTSMKTIATRVGVAVGNIYNYYAGKDELLKAVLAPLFNAIEGYRAQNLDVTYTSLDIYRYEVYYEMMRRQAVSLIIPYRKEFRLLLFETAGTSLENYFDRLSEMNCDDGRTYIEHVKARYPHITADVSTHFIRILCELWAGLIKHIVVNDGLNEAELDRIISNYVRFGIGGWKNLLGIDADE